MKIWMDVDDKLRWNYMKIWMDEDDKGGGRSRWKIWMEKLDG